MIDNPSAPLEYPLFIKFFTMFGIDDFWSSKLVGILAYTFIVLFTYQKKFFYKEVLISSALFSYVSVFSYTMSEGLALPFIILLFYMASQIIRNEISVVIGIFFLSLVLIILINIRYSALFLCVGCLVFGMICFRKNFLEKLYYLGHCGHRLLRFVQNLLY